MSDKPLTERAIEMAKQTPPNTAQVEIDTEHVEASIAVEKWRTRFMAYVRKMWKGDTVAGARIEKKF